MRLLDKVTIVTGSSSGLGRAIAVLFAQEGAKVVVNANRNVAGGEETVAIIKKAGGKAILVQASVASGADCKRLVQTAVDTFGGVNILVNNAGVEIRGGVLTLTEEEWDQMLNVDLKGIFLCSKEAIPHMIKAGGGSIVNVGSVLSFDVIPERAAYCAAKAGVVGLTKALAVELAAKKINVNAIGPCNVRTPMNAHLMDDPTFYKFLVDSTPWGRVSKPSDISPAAVYLASDEADYVTGHTLYIDGGWLAK